MRSPILVFFISLLICTFVSFADDDLSLYLPDEADENVKAVLPPEGTFPAPKVKELQEKMSREITKNLGLTKIRDNDSCEKISKPGECSAEKKRALIVYDPLAFHRSKIYQGKSLSESADPGNDCLLVRLDLEKNGYCVEALKIENPESLGNFLSLHPEFKGRYSQVSNLSHGSPGFWHAPRSVCADVAEKECNSPLAQNLEEHSDCVASAMAKKGYEQDCPCWSAQDELNAARNAKKNFKKEEAFEVYSKLLATEKSKFAKLMDCEETNKNKYLTNQKPSDTTQLLADGGQVYSISCSTGTDTKKAIRLRNEICDNSPLGTVFNLSLKDTQAGEYLSSDVVAMCGIECIAQMCDEGKCTPDEAKKVAEYYKMSATAYIKPADGHFACYRCDENKIAIPVACENMLIPGATSIDPALKEKTGGHNSDPGS